MTTGAAHGSWLTPRLRLEPVGPARAHDLWLVHSEPEVARWYDGWDPTPQAAAQHAQVMGDAWRRHGVHKWIAYERTSGQVVGRGGLSRTPVDEDWGQLHALLPDEPWVPLPLAGDPSVHAHWLELGWALRPQYWGLGFAAEIGRAGLAFAFDVLDARAVVSCTVRHNRRSRAVMERIGMRYAGEIRSPGAVEGSAGIQQDAPYSVCVQLRPPG